MSHVHVPDGVLPPALWAVAWGVALLLLVISSRASRGDHPQRIAYQGALGALTLAAMAIEIPVGPLEAHLTLLGPIGVLLGPAGAFQVMFVVSVMLAFIGHGGFTVIGINALVLGAGALLARPIFQWVARGRSSAFAMATASAVAQSVAGALWLGIMAIALRARSWTNAEGGVERFAWIAGLGLPLWLIVIVVEAMIAFGIARFLERVRPDLLPVARSAESGLAATT